METKQSFILKATRTLLSHNFSVLLYNTEKLEDNCGGWCWIDDSESKREFAVAMKHHMGFEIFIHEYCHFLQWRDKRRFWNESFQDYDIIFDWVEDQRLETSEEDLQRGLKSILDIEHDCETMVLKLVKNNPIEDFNTEKYIKAANAYLLNYHIIKELRQRPKNPIYTKSVLESMPDSFQSLDYYLDRNNISLNMREALLSEYENCSSAG